MNRRCLLQSLPLALLTLVVAGGCTSTHNLKTDGHNPLGGGFADEEIRSGLYLLTATGNMSPWPSFTAANGTWRGRADQLCGKNAYQEITISRDAGYQGTTPTYVSPSMMLDIPRHNTSVSGYVLCNASGMTRNEAIKYLTELAAMKAQERMSSHREELEKLGGTDCSVDEIGMSAETLFRRGKLLLATNDYKSAMNCFTRAQELEQGTSVYRESCSSIGTMYELGWGVEKDIPTAMSWYRKAGL